jgi:hypothetical protein
MPNTILITEKIESLKKDKTRMTIVCYVNDTGDIMVQ